MSNDENIIWMAPDGSWGGCKRGDLLIVRESDLTDADRDVIDEAAAGENEDVIYEVLLAVQKRAEASNDTEEPA